MIISIASGKGGAGKTTVATNLAFSLGKNVQLLDCDVEEPNAHLFLNPEISETQTVTLPVPLVDKDLCTYCKKCAEICRFKAITVLGTKSILTFPKMCHSCGGCMVVCPEKAISETERKLGVIELGRAGKIDFVHGLLSVGESMAPPLIEKVRSCIDPDKLAIIDAPPGTSCPVITAMKKTDFVLLVTEPTPFGLHDLKLTVEAVRELKIPMGLVINRADMGDRAVYEYAGQEDIPILMEIPFDRNIAMAYSRGKLFTREMPEWQEKFRQLLTDIKFLLRAEDHA